MKLTKSTTPQARDYQCDTSTEVTNKLYGRRFQEVKE